jgi:tRNA 2-(methylsulfanyl)-N6-isopentenyladenosine37 hydroxylase
MGPRAAPNPGLLRSPRAPPNPPISTSAPASKRLGALCTPLYSASDVLCLTHPTAPRWAEIAVAGLDAVLTDHAHCEMKAASNAISLATRWPASAGVARALSAVAEEELGHFREVLGLLERRGVELGRPETDAYAADLRRAALATGDKSPRGSLADRLLVGALIEARSCERFRLLADALAARGDALAAFYEELFACEARHYTTMVDLAIEVQGDEARVRDRLTVLARAEGEIAARLGARPAIHG